MIRLIKVLLALCIALLCLLHALQNLANLDQAHGAVAYTLGRVDQQVYPGGILSGIESPALAWLALGIIIAMEFLAGVIALKGSWDLFCARGADGAEFHAAKKMIVIAAGVAMLVWFGLFHVIAGSLFQQWQTPAGGMSLGGAFWYGSIPVLIVLYICQTPDD